MNAKTTFDRARSSGYPLGTSDARVLLHREASQGHRVWLGTDTYGLAVAYFEIYGLDLPIFNVSRAIHVEPVETVIHRPMEEVRAAKVSCRERELYSVFSAFMDDVIEQLDTKDPVTALLDSASSWRRLLQVARAGISEAAALGLYGELRFLEDLMAHHGPQSIEAWQVSGGDIHDFIGERVRVEVKSSSFQNHQSITVHGLKQLEAPANSRLILAVADIQKHGDGETVDHVTSRLIANGADHAVLTDKLSKAGYVRGMLNPEEESTFTLTAWRFWEITAKTPVLSTSTVEPRITAALSDVRYSLALAALGDPETEFDWEEFSDTSRRVDL